MMDEARLCRHRAGMDRDELIERTMQFALRVAKMVEALP